MDHARELGDKSEIEALLDNVRKEKDVLEGQVASLQEQLSRSQCEVSKLREQLSSLQEECKVGFFFVMCWSNICLTDIFTSICFIKGYA